MKLSNYKVFLLSLALVGLFASCSESSSKEVDTVKKEVSSEKPEMSDMGNDSRLSLELNSMQKNHQLVNMRDHLVAVQSIISLLASEKYDEASEVAYSKLGSTTEMKLMCASFGDKDFENLGLSFHESADEMSEVFKSKDKNASLEALAITVNYCVQCHAAYRQ